MRTTDKRVTTRMAHNRVSRRTVLAGMAALPLLAACARPSAAPQSTATLDDLPIGLGRGFPLGTTAGLSNRSSGVNPGDVAPDFLLKLADDSMLSFHDLAGRPRLLNFWATWCGPCRIEMPEIVAAASTHADVLVVAVNVQEELDVVTEFAEDFDMNILVPLDTNAEIRNVYAVRGMPTTYFIDRENRIHSVWLGVLTPAKLDEFLAELV